MGVCAVVRLGSSSAQLQSAQLPTSLSYSTPLQLCHAPEPHAMRYGCLCCCAAREQLSSAPVSSAPHEPIILHPTAALSCSRAACYEIWVSVLLCGSGAAQLSSSQLSSPRAYHTPPHCSSVMLPSRM